MANFKFVNRKTGETAKLVVVEERMCALQGITPDPKFNCPLYDGLINVGFAILLESGGEEVTAEALDKWIEEFKVRVGEKEYARNEEGIKIIRQIMIDEYIFIAWR